MHYLRQWRHMSQRRKVYEEMSARSVRPDGSCMGGSLSMAFLLSDWLYKKNVFRQGFTDSIIAT